ncbi:MAG: phage head-tail connector protein [Rhodocyclaceae bacterium]|nr:phage head-tail connector protein [Rhodocyclaceae bacterium]
MTTFLITAPATEPATLDEVKLHIRQDSSIGALEDALLNRLIKSARQRAEHMTSRAFITQTWGVRLDAFPTLIELVRSPVISITDVKYLDSTGVEQTINAADYILDNFGTTGFIAPAYGKSWPSTYQQINAVRVQYVAGYGAAAAVPECVKDWMLLVIEDAYRNRGATVDATIKPHPFLDSILDPITVQRIG